MKLSQLLHSIEDNQLIMVSQKQESELPKVLVRGTRKDVQKEDAINNYRVDGIRYNQAIMIVYISDTTNYRKVVH